MTEKDKRLDTKIGGCLLLEKIGEGGMGAVYMARQLSLDRVVALKILSPIFARDKDKRERFLKEAKASAKLHHPNIISIHSAGFDGGNCYYTMEYIEGGSVKDIIEKEGKIPEDRALEIVYEIAQGLQHAFQKHLIHRDVKPDNFMVTKEGGIKLCDLGLAKILVGDDAHQTQVGTFMGTPYYTSPEQAKGNADIDIRSDLYSLGASLFHMLTGQHPFEGTSPIAVITMHINDQPPLVNGINSAISKVTTQLVDKLLKKNPADRYQTPLELMDAIAEILKKFHKKNKSLRVSQQIPVTTVEHETSGLNIIKPIIIALGAIIFAMIVFAVIKQTKTKKDPETGSKPTVLDSGLLKSFNADRQKLLALLLKTDVTTWSKKDKFREIADVYSKALPDEVKKLAIEMEDVLDSNGSKLANSFSEKAIADADKFFMERKYGNAFRTLLTISDSKLNINIEDLIKGNKEIFLEKAKKSRKSFLNKLLQDAVPIKSNEDYLQVNEVRDLLSKQKEFEDILITLNKEIADYFQKTRVKLEKPVPKVTSENEKTDDKKTEESSSKLSPEILGLTKSLSQNITDKKFVETNRLYLKNKDKIKSEENEKLIRSEFPETMCAVESIEITYRDFSRNIRRLMEGETIEISNVKYILVRVTPDSLTLMDSKSELKEVAFDKLPLNMLQNYTSSLREYDQSLKLSVGVYTLLSGDKAKGNDILKNVDATEKNKYKSALDKLQK